MKFLFHVFVLQYSFLKTHQKTFYKILGYAFNYLVYFLSFKFSKYYIILSINFNVTFNRYFIFVTIFVKYLFSFVVLVVELKNRNINKSTDKIVLPPKLGGSDSITDIPSFPSKSKVWFSPNDRKLENFIFDIPFIKGI